MWKMDETGRRVWSYDVTKLLKLIEDVCSDVRFSFHYIWFARLIRFVIKRKRKWKFCKMCYALMVTFYQSNVNNLENYLIILDFCLV